MICSDQLIPPSVWEGSEVILGYKSGVFFHVLSENTLENYGRRYGSRMVDAAADTARPLRSQSDVKVLTGYFKVNT